MGDISKMIGRIPTEINHSDEDIIFEFDDGSVARFCHYQDCCESVTVDDVNGDWNDLIGVPILVAEERVSDTFEGNPRIGCRDDSETWTFYTFRSIKGSVDVRWYGSSNGYYSESVDFQFDAPTQTKRKG